MKKSVVMFVLAAPARSSFPETVGLVKEMLMMKEHTDGSRIPRHSEAKAVPGPEYTERCFPFSMIQQDYVLKHSSFLPNPDKAVPGPCNDVSASALRHQLMRLGSPTQCVADMQVGLYKP